MSGPSVPVTVANTPPQHKITQPTRALIVGLVSDLLRAVPLTHPVLVNDLPQLSASATPPVPHSDTPPSAAP